MRIKKVRCLNVMSLIVLLLISFSHSFVLIHTSKEIVRASGISSLETLKIPKMSSLNAAISDNSAKVGTVDNSSRKSLTKNIEVLFYFSLWYFISIFYNIYNKRALQLLKLPWLVATSQMGLGLPIFIPLWLLHLREFPADNLSDFKEILYQLKEVAVYQTLTHISGVIALGAGAVSFTQVVKASEPAFTALLSAVFEKEFFALPVYLTLVPVIAGVGMASLTELTFSWYCFWAGISANVFAAARGVFGKKQMCGETKCIEQIAPENYYAILTLLSFFMLIPLTALVEGSKIAQLDFNNKNVILGLQNTVFSGFLFYLYNEVSFKALNNVHPITHALANTLKRIVIIVSSLIVFGNPMSPLGILGSSLAIIGVCGYSLAQHMTKKQASAAAGGISAGSAGVTVATDAGKKAE